MNGGTSDNVGSRHVRARLDESCINEAPRRGPNAGVPHTVRRVGGKDRHSKVNTAKGLRDRRVRLSAATAIQFFDVQDRLGFDQPSKAVDWLIKQAQAAIDKLGKVPDTDTKLAMASSSSSSQVKKEEEREASKVSGGSDVKALKDGDGARSRSGTAQDQLDLAIDSHQNHQQRQQAILEHSLPLPANRSFIMQSPEIMQYFAHQIQQLPCSVLPRQTHLQSLPMLHPSSSLQPYLEDRSNRITAASNQMPSAAPIDLFLQQHHHHLHAGLSSVPFQADSSARSVVLSQAINHSISSSPMQLQQVHNTRRAGLPMINNMSMTQQADAPRLANLMHPSLPNRGTLQSISSFNSYTPFMNLAGNNNAFHNVHDSGIYRMLSAMAGKDDNGFLQTSSVPITPSRIFDKNEMDQEGSGLPSSL